MNSIADSKVAIQTSAQPVASPPSWLGEVSLIAHYLSSQGTLAAIGQQVRFARRRFGRYEVIDFVAVLFGYAISGERTPGVMTTSVMRGVFRAESETRMEFLRLMRT